jgi:prepilin-type N-terminal cleavage/methylation domain-containing protein
MRTIGGQTGGLSLEGESVLQRFRAVRKNEDGFTLIELLIVIVILGVLSGIVVFAVSAFNDRGYQAACKTDMKSVEVAAEAYKAKSVTGAWPASYTDIVPTYLRTKPTSPNYTITLGNADGVVTGTLTGPPTSAC